MNPEDRQLTELELDACAERAKRIKEQLNGNGAHAVPDAYRIAFDAIAHRQPDSPAKREAIAEMERMDRGEACAPVGYPLPPPLTRAKPVDIPKEWRRARAYRMYMTMKEDNASYEKLAWMFGLRSAEEAGQIVRGYMAARPAYRNVNH